MGGRKSIKEKLKKFKEKVSEAVPIKKIILFGSRAEGKTGKNRDIDLMIISPEFRKLDFFQRGAKMYNYWDLDYAVDFLCYTPEEFDNLSKKITIVREGLKKGIVI